MSYEGTTRKDLLPTELTSVKRLRESGGRLPDGSGFSTVTVKTESAEGGPGSGPRKGGNHSETPKQGKSLKDHVGNILRQVSNGTDEDFKFHLRAAAKAAKQEGNSKAIQAIQYLRKASDYENRGGEYGSDTMLDRADTMYEKGASLLKKSIGGVKEAIEGGPGSGPQGGSKKSPGERIK